MTGLAADLGLALPDAQDLVRAGAALVVIVLTIVAAWLVGRWSGPVLADFWERRIGSLVWRGQEIWHEHFVFGVGLKNFRRFCERDDFLPRGPVETRCYTHPHQIWNEWLAETGAVGFAGFLALLALWGSAIARGLRRLGEDYPLALGALISLVIILWPLRTSMSFFSNWLAAMFWLMLGLTLALTALRGGRRPSPPS